MKRITMTVFTLLFCLVAFHSATLADCIPTYSQAAPDTLESDCQGFLPSYRLYKTSHWAIYWPGYGPFTNSDPWGKGQCTPNLQCWPSFDTPQTISEQFSQRVVYRKLNCSDPATGQCTTCLYWGEKTYYEYPPCGACGYACLPEGCEFILCPLDLLQQAGTPGVSPTNNIVYTYDNSQASAGLYDQLVIDSLSVVLRANRYLFIVVRLASEQDKADSDDNKDQQDNDHQKVPREVGLAWICRVRAT